MQKCLSFIRQHHQKSLSYKLFIQALAVMRDRQEREAGGETVWGSTLCQAPGSHQSVPGLSLAAEATPQLRCSAHSSHGAPETACGWGRKYFER